MYVTRGWLVVGTLSLPPLTVWPIAGLQQPNRWQQELSQCPQDFTPDAFPATTLFISRLEIGTEYAGFHTPWLGLYPVTGYD